MTTASTPFSYRPDIDGLRAIAVLAVVGFHAFPGRLGGGFVGVDVFFVISGYLITSIIMTDLHRGEFRIGNFYARRVRRIFPSLALVLAAALVLGWPLLLSAEYAGLGKHVVAGTLFVSNFVLYSESGYFDELPMLKPLLHLWSLAVEEQFYLLWPVLLAAAWARRIPAWPVTLAVGAASFAANIYMFRDSPSAAFFWPVSRFWELMAGCALAVHARTHATQLRPQWLIELTGATGAVLLAAALLLVKKHDFPGWWALLPVAAACMLIVAGPTAWINRVLLSSRPLVAIGLISYPLYLWHWLLLSSGFIFNNYYPPLWAKLALIALAFVLAWASYRFVELRLRSPGATARPLTMPIAAMAVVLAAGAILALGWVRNTPMYYEVPAAQVPVKPTESGFYSGDAFRFDAGSPRVIVFGDSQARDIFRALRNDPSMGLHYFRSPVPCTALAEAVASRADMASHCAANFRALLDSKSIEQADVLIYARLWDAEPWNHARFEQHLHTLRQRNPRLSIQAWGHKPHLGHRDLPIRRIMRSYPGGDINAYLKSMSVRAPVHVETTNSMSRLGVRWVDVASIYCTSGCEFHNADGYAYFDIDHWTSLGAQIFYSRLRADPVYQTLTPR